MQGAVSQLNEVRERKLADKDVINQKDAAQITAAEAKLHGGQTPPNSISSQSPGKPLMHTHLHKLSGLDGHQSVLL